MAMGMVNIENIKFFLPKIISKIEDVTQVGPEKRRMIKLHRMIQMKSIRNLHSGPGNPFLDAILNRKGGLPIGKGDIMPPFFQSLTEVPCRISRTCPLPIAEKMKDFHRSLFEMPPHPCLPAPVPHYQLTEGGAGTLLLSLRERA
jgi:hypothetical protein